MAETVFKISGVDFLPFVAEGGIDIDENDIESEEAGMMLDGTIRRDRIIIRRKINVTPRTVPALSSAELSSFLRALRPQFVNVQFNDPFEGTVITRVFYNSQRGAVLRREYDNKTMWDMKPFALIEQGVSGYA